MNKRLLVLGLGVLIYLLANQSEPAINKPVQSPPKVQQELKVKVIMPRPKSAAVKSPAPAQDDVPHQGQLPPIEASYRQTIGFRAYALAMEERGALFLMKSKNKGEFHHLNYRGGKVETMTLAQLKSRGLSSRTRLLGKEPALQKLQKEAVQEGARGSVFLLVPTHFEAIIAQEFFAKSPLTQGLLSIKGQYAFTHSGFVLKINQVATKQGLHKLNFSLKL
ncbi:hypothetical protein PQO03_01490 [Lentisphaera profundi]|uniref:Uncharacterized protein n=1 Tax=Lentisphaera profundi TaxID=1658616 RepID=A0ABY7VTT8_9BACT|nr:hypothetical protein [Lentisphaera profundi]WDE96640.1 hypothetical protein PQO03_01490 [Lentisphaera profundi]